MAERALAEGARTQQHSALSLRACSVGSAHAPPSALSSAPLRPLHFPPFLLLLLLQPRPLPDLASSDPRGCPPLHSPLAARAGAQRCRAGRSPRLGGHTVAPSARRAARWRVKWGDLRGAVYRRTDPDFAGSLRQRGRWRCSVSECDLSACASTRVTSVCMGMCVRANNHQTGLRP